MAIRRRAVRRQWRLSAHAMRRVRMSALGAVCGVTLAAILWCGLAPSVHWVTSHPYFALRSISIDGQRRLTREEVLQWAELDDGMSIWNVAPGAVRRRLQRHPWVQRVNVQREFPHDVRIMVEERHPVAIAWLDQAQYVDRGGNILGPLRDNDSRDFPMITGIEGTDAQGFSGVALHRALQLLRWCERLNCFDAVSEVHVDRDRGVTVFPAHSTVAVLLGWGAWRQKLARSARVFALWEGQVGRLTAVDVSFRDLVVVKLQDTPHPPARRAAKRGTRV